MPADDCPAQQWLHRHFQLEIWKSPRKEGGRPSVAPLAWLVAVLVKVAGRPGRGDSLSLSLLRQIWLFKDAQLALSFFSSCI